MKCYACGRDLKSAASREAGYGPVCYKKMFGKSLRIRDGDRQIRTSTDDFPYYDIPGQMSIEDFLGNDEK